MPVLQCRLLPWPRRSPPVTRRRQRTRRLINPPRRKLASLYGRQLFWVRPQFFKREHHLLVDDEIVAIMSFEGLNGATATTANSSWLIERRGIFRIGAAM